MNDFCQSLSSICSDVIISTSQGLTHIVDESREFNIEHFEWESTNKLKSINSFQQNIGKITFVIATAV